MDHREQTQKEAEQWQKTSVKLIRRIRYGVLIFGILVVAVMFLGNLGFTREVNTGISAAMITEDGKIMDIQLELRGEVTNYPFSSRKYAQDDQITLYVTDSGKRVIQLYPTEEFFFGQTKNAVCVLNYKRDHLLLETDVQFLFPHLEGKMCLVTYGYDSFDLSGEYAEYFTFLKTNP